MLLSACCGCIWLPGQRWPPLTQVRGCALIGNHARAWVRVHSQAGTAARIAQAEVGRLKGLLATVDGGREKAGGPAGATGVLDTSARVPWRPIGQGTRAADPHPERLGRPWDHPDVELTFQPR